MTSQLDKTQNRRSQEQRRRATTNKLIEATIEVVNENGYSGLRATAITKKAGVTWGAVQHLFGDKENLLLTVANRTYEELSRALNADISPNAPLNTRVEQIIDLTWKAYQSEAYLAMVEILRGSRSQPTFNKELLKRQQSVNDDVRNTWLRLFSTSDIDARAIDDARDLVTLTLSGLAARRIFLRSHKDPKNIISMLNEATVHVLNSTFSHSHKSEPAGLTVLV
ncbi:MAG: TetR/AcrR family transcriptional regulator [Pseudomonadota bacterium]